MFMMPQIDFSTYIPQIFWFIISFVCIFFISHYLIIPSIAANIKKRQKVIEEILNITKKNLSQAELVKNSIHELKAKTYHDNMQKINRANEDMSYKLTQEIEILKKEIRLKEDQEITKIEHDVENLKAILNQKKIILTQEILKAFETINIDEIKDNIINQLEF